MAKSSKLAFLKIVNGSLQNKTYSFAAFTIIVVIVLLLGAVRPTLLTITKINKDIREKKHINEQLELKLNNLSLLSNYYIDIYDQRENLPLIFPTQNNFSLFMANIEKIAKANGYNLEGISFGSADDLNFKLVSLKPWSARLAISGNKANLISLLNDFESMPMFPVVNKVSFSNNNKDGEKTLYNIELVIFKIDDPKFYN